MKIFKKICSILAIIIGIIFINGCYFVYKGQEKASLKLASNIELNVYEKLSTYSVHTACWMFGWIVSPESAEQAFLMNFPQDSVIYRNNDFFKDSELLYKYINDNGEIDYPLNYITQNNLKETRYATALDGGIYKSQDITEIGPYNAASMCIESCTVKAEYSNYVGVYKIGPIKFKFDWGLCQYLQNKGWLHTYTICYTTS